jgi:hypothetical protein
MSYTLINNGDTGLSIRNTLNNALQDLNNGKYGLAGTQYIFVSANGTPQENAAELQAAYNQAKTMSPTANNRITVVAAPGTYKFSSTFVMDTEYIDLVSLTGNRDVVFDLDVEDPFQFNSSPYSIISIGECLLIDTDNVYVKGIKGKFYSSANWKAYWNEGEDYILPIQVSTNLPNIVVENCKGGIFSFGGDTTFGNNPITLSGTFINCEHIGDFGFGSYGILSGTFIECQGYQSSFGNSGIISGILINCKNDNGFSTNGIASGTFINCQNNLALFGGSTCSGTFTNCIGGESSFGSFGTASGIFTNCVGGNNSFGGGFNGTLTGKLYYCRLTQGTFQTVSGGGRTIYCIDGVNNTNNQ